MYASNTVSPELPMDFRRFTPCTRHGSLKRWLPFLLFMSFQTSRNQLKAFELETYMEFASPGNAQVQTKNRTASQTLSKWCNHHHVVPKLHCWNSLSSNDLRNELRRRQRNHGHPLFRIPRYHRYPLKLTPPTEIRRRSRPLAYSQRYPDIQARRLSFRSRDGAVDNQRSCGISSRWDG